MNRFVLACLTCAIPLSSSALAAPTRPSGSVPMLVSACGAVVATGAAVTTTAAPKPCLFPVLGNSEPQIASVERKGPPVPQKRRFFGLPIFALLGALGGAGGIAALDSNDSSPR